MKAHTGTINFQWVEDKDGNQYICSRDLVKDGNLTPEVLAQCFDDSEMAFTRND